MQVSTHHSDLLFSSLSHIGWNHERETQFLKYSGPYIPGRVCTVHKTRCEVIIPDNLISVPISGAMKTNRTYPVVGDFVVLVYQPESAIAMIVAILQRKNSLSRGGAGESAGEQVLAANIDTAFIVTEPGTDFNISRIERYMLIVGNSGAHPVIILNKCDSCDDITDHVNAIKSEIGDVPVIPISALYNTGLEQVQPYLSPGKTIIFLGSSGVGKSTLINAITGCSIQKTGEIRTEDGRGRHTTSVRHFIPLKDGCNLIDTPGLREIRVWTAEEQISEAFEDIQHYASYCKFTNCTHHHEPGCAVLKAVQEGLISEDRLMRYQKIRSEVAFEKDKVEIGLKRLEKKRFKEISKTAKALYESEKWRNQR